MDGKTLVNVIKCKIINERTGDSFDIGDTADEIGVEPILSQGKRDILRVKNKILAINETDDIAIGYTLKLKDNTFNMDVMKIVDGGSITSGKYESPSAGEVVNKDLFTLEVYTEEKDYSRTTGYTKFSWKHCKGKVPKYKIKDGDFIVPEFEAESIPFRGEKTITIETGLDDISGGNNSTNNLAVVGGTVTSNNSSVGVSITTNIKWTFTNAINQDDVTAANFFVKKQVDNSLVPGSLTIDTTKTIVTFIPSSIQMGTTYVAEALAVQLLDGSGTTTALSTEFTTV
jgi:hypothetical protein